MGETTPEKRDKIDAALTSKGFLKMKNKDHHRYSLKIDGKITHIGTKMSMGSNHKTVADNLHVQMYKQLRMKNKSEFKSYIECTYSYESYVKSLIEANEL